MTTEYLILGVLLLVMGGVQIWLRHGPGAAEREELINQRKMAANPPDYRRPGGGAGPVRRGKIWEAWTRILGFLGVALGIALIVLGVLGR